MHGDPALPADFDHFPYANPDAPKGGLIAYAGQGTFDSLNPFIVKGAVPDGLWARTPFWGDNVWESLLISNWDEPFTLYGHLAQFVEVPDDRSWVEFTMDPRARFSDGEPVTAEDVVFSFELLKEKGRPAGWYKHVTNVEIKAGGKVRFTFGDGGDRELPLIVGLMHIFPKHATDPETFDQTTLKPPIGSGPYVIAERRRRQDGDAEAQSRLLGEGPAAEARLRQFRRDSHRIHPRRQLAVRGVQEGPLRRQSGSRPDPLDDRLHLPRREGRRRRPWRRSRPARRRA